MIEKKISYDINIEKPSKTKPVKQGGVLNYLGKQKTVNAPVKWRSSKDHPIAHLSYITKDEEKILIDLNLYGSLKGKPNRGPFGLPSLQGSGGGAGGDGGSSGGDSGGSSDSSSNSSSDSSSDSSSAAGVSSADSAAGAGFGSSATGEGGGEADAASSGGDTGMSSAESAQEAGFGDDPAGEFGNVGEETAETGVMSTLANVVNMAVQSVKDNPLATAIGMVNPVAGFAARAIASAVSAANRGVTAPNDYSQATESVQNVTQDPGGGGGILTLPQYAPLYNQATGDPLLDSLIARYKANISPSSFGV